MAHRTHGMRTARTCAALALAAALALCAALAPYAGPDAARADEMPVTQSSPATDAVPTELQQRVEQTAAAYNEAVAAREEVEAQAADCETRIAALQEQLPAAQDQAAAALGTLYKLHQNSNGLLELLLSADSFNAFITTLVYFNSVSDECVAQLEDLKALSDQLAAEQASLQAALEEARTLEEQAEAALAEAQAAREEAQRRAAEEAARRQAEIAAALAAQQAREQAQSDAGTAGDADDGAGSGDQGASEGQGGSENGGAEGSEGSASDGGWSENGGSDEGYIDEGGSWEEPSDGGVDWTDERSVFISEWGARIDAYLAGSPLGGYGSTFAAAAWDYGVDPRWSPAIACIESTKGAYCFLPHNAWGWGSVSWDSWEEAIYGHVGGLARGYGYTISYDAALRYCPSNADYWYSAVLAQMERI